jgi:hypothetical protein
LVANWTDDKNLRQIGLGWQYPWLQIGLGCVNDENSLMQIGIGLIGRQWRWLQIGLG